VGKVRLSSGGESELAAAPAATGIARAASAEIAASRPRNDLNEIEECGEEVVTGCIAPHLFEKFFRTFG
jgi:hypothetical protein